MQYSSAALAILFIPVLGKTAEVVTSKSATGRGTDLTVVSGASGENVVDACIQKIGTVPAGIFENDFGFLKRIALVESNFGVDDDENPTGGIWQITTSIHETIFRSLRNISTNRMDIATILGQEVVDFVSNDYSVPLKSAIAARFFIEIISSDDIPGSLEDQASWWATHYHPGGMINDFISNVQQFEDSTRCKVPKLDLWFVIDASGSIRINNFNTCLEFVNNTAASFSISPDEVRTGLMIYSSDSIIRSRFDEHQSNADFSKVVLETDYPGGGTYTGAAITRVREIGFNVTNGARPPTEAVPRILIVLTDGKSGDDVAQPSDEIKESGVSVFGVGVGRGFNEQEIKEIASDPDSGYAFELTQFKELAEILQGRVAIQACTVPAVVPENTTVSVTVEARSTFYSQVALPKNGSVKLTYEVASAAVVYLSDSVPNPSSALFDDSFEVNAGVTVVMVNSAEEGGSLEVVGKRRKRETSEEETQPLYLAYESKSSEPVDMKLTATQSNVRAVAGSGTTERSFKKATTLLAMFTVLVCFYA